jgi:hypothetical protein
LILAGQRPGVEEHAFAVGHAHTMLALVGGRLRRVKLDPGNMHEVYIPGCPRQSPDAITAAARRPAANLAIPAGFPVSGTGPASSTGI